MPIFFVASESPPPLLHPYRAEEITQYTLNLPSMPCVEDRRVLLSATEPQHPTRISVSSIRSTFTHKYNTFWRENQTKARCSQGPAEHTLFKSTIFPVDRAYAEHTDFRVAPLFWLWLVMLSRHVTERERARWSSEWCYAFLFPPPIVL